MKTHIHWHLLLFFSLLLGIAMNPAQAQFALGARALGMGGAFTAIADGDGATWWNPAAVAGRRSPRVLLPNLTVQVNGPQGIDEALRGIPSNWDDRFQLFRKWTSGVTHASAGFSTGFQTSGFSLNVIGFGSGTAIPTDSDGTVGRLTLTKDFTVTALQNATNEAYQEAGFSSDQATTYAQKIANYIQTTYPGANTITLPAYGTRVDGQYDIYGSITASAGKQIRPGLQVGVNLSLVGARHTTRFVRFDNQTFLDKASQVTDSTASPALVDRVLRNLDLRMPNGDYFAGQNLAGDKTTYNVTDGLEIRPSADVGALWQASPRLRAGAVIRNLLPADFDSAAPLRTHFDFGVAFIATPTLLVAADLTNVFDTAATRLNFGVEWYPVHSFAIRMGVYHGQFTIGAGTRQGLSFAIAPSGFSLLSVGLGF